jgi:hypothetical protein
VTLILSRVDATSNVHQLDFNKRILILKMHGTNMKINFFLFKKSPETECGLGSRIYGTYVKQKCIQNFFFLKKPLGIDGEVKKPKFTL